jgi:hypothetical protein
MGLISMRHKTSAIKIISLPALLIFCSFALLATFSQASKGGTTAIATYHYDNLRTGWNQRETVLTPANVGNLRLQKLVRLDEQVDAQPLWVAGVTIVGGKHNVLYIATENDTVFAIDAATGAILLRRKLGTPVPKSALPGKCNTNSVVVGISSTPVIDSASNAAAA